MAMPPVRINNGKRQPRAEDSKYFKREGGRTPSHGANEERLENKSISSEQEEIATGVSKKSKHKEKLLIKKNPEGPASECIRNGKDQGNGRRKKLREF